MKYLFTKENLKKLKKIVNRRTLFAFDFDGVLAPLTKRPSNAIVYPETEKLLKELNKKLIVAIVT